MSETTQALAPQVSIADALAFDIMERRKAELVKGAQSYPRSQPILSDIGDCDRQIAYGVTNWKDREAPDVELLARFEAGNVQEREITTRLINMGYKVTLQQQPVEVKGRDGQLLARGKVDGFITFNGIKIPFEIKSMNPNVYNNVEIYEDFQKKPWLRKYPRQLQMYLLGNNCEWGLFILTDCLGHWKIIPVALSYEEGEAILQRLERVHAHLKAGTYPDRIDYRADICGQCAFAMICLPDVMRSQAIVLTDADTLTMLDERERLKPLHSQYEEVDKALKGKIKASGVTKAIAGDWILSTKVVHKNAYSVEAQDQINVSIQKLKEKK